jgi:hypothetical protein
MSDSMINKSSPTPKKGVDGIGDTTTIHYNQWDMNNMNDPISPMEAGMEHYYTKGQSKQK